MDVARLIAVARLEGALEATALVGVLVAKGSQLLQAPAAILYELLVCLNTFCGLLLQEELGMPVILYVSSLPMSALRSSLL
jgi:hypothetical protein